MNQQRYYDQLWQAEIDATLDRARDHLMPGACEWCGTDYGLRYHYADLIDVWPSHYYIDLLETGEDGTGPDGVYTPCPTCRRTRVPAGFLEVTCAA